MRAFSGCVAALLMALCATSLASGQGRVPVHTQPGPMLEIIGYLPDWRLKQVPLPALRPLTDLIYFSIEPAPDGSLNTERCGPDALERLRQIRAVFPGRILIAVGGWERSAGFARAATNPVSRERLARNLAHFCTQNGFDGVDFDWEHPANAEEAAAYGALVVGVKRVFRLHRLFVSVTLARVQHLDRAGYAAADRVQVMSYDHPGKHSTLAQMQKDVTDFLKAGVPANKLCPGLPFYGRSLKDWHQTLAYAEIVAQFQPDPEDDEAGDFYFNGLQTVRAKVRYCREKGLRGIMFWELGQDTRDATSLLRAIYQEARTTAGKQGRDD
ncbi:MAG: glycoside hydrolase family 18 protein [Chloroherpetonaceae bacterium]|nr:glycoside hydrolase family 18 protein [Chthonomonadaceae bacterium]MDW8209183.1 glycoside hydrolase family 18 protein [Chloroherpetonaceae bacterium]